MICEEATEVILEAKMKKEFTFEAIAQKVGAHKVRPRCPAQSASYVPEQADTVVDLLDLGEEVGRPLQEIPLHGALDQNVPTDPTIYRIHEVTQVYGATIQSTDQRRVRGWLMSAITLHMGIEREETDAGPRVKSTYDGKFLP